MQDDFKRGTLMRRVRVLPSKPVSALGMIVGLVFVCIGIFVAIPIFGPFGILWTLVAAAIAIFNALNVFSNRGIATTEIDIEGDDFLGRQSEQLPFDERLRKLEQLRKEELITELEYRQKREELMSIKW